MASNPSSPQCFAGFITRQNEQALAVRQTSTKYRPLPDMWYELRER